MSKTPLCALFAVEDIVVKCVLAAMAAMTLGVVHAADVTLKATDDLAAAVETAEADDTITLLPGEYKLTKTLTIDKGVTLKGVHRELVHLVPAGTGYVLVKVNHADAVLSGVTVRNASTGESAAVIVNAGVFGDSVVRNNANSSRNGIVYVFGEHAYMRRVVCRDNSNGTYGGGCWLDRGTVANCLFHDNYASWGGGIYAPNSGVRRVVNCTAVGNMSGADVNGHDLCWWSDTPVTKNCAFGNVRSDKAGANATSFAEQDTTSTPFCTIVESLGLDVNYTPTEGSPLIGAGAPDEENVYLDGSLHDATAPTAGCYPPNRIVATIDTASHETYAKGDTVDILVSIKNASADATATVQVYTQEGLLTELDAREAVDGRLPLEITAYGWYHLVLTVDDGARKANAGVYQAFQCGANHLYVDPSSPNPALPFDSWETAAHTIDEALATAADEGCTITVADGTYALESEIVVTKAVLLESAHGAAATKLTAGGVAGVRPLTINNAKAVVRGFTITEGRGTKGGGVLFGAKGGTLDQCVVADCVSSGHGGGVYLVPGAELKRTVVRGCQTTGSTSYGGGAYFDKGGYAENCLFYGSSSSYGCNIYTDGGNGGMANCTVGKSSGTSFYNYSTGFTATNCAFYSALWHVNHPAGPLVNNKTGTDLGWADANGGDYTLKVSSVLKDAGDDSVTGTITTDLIGTARPQFEHVDIGCYEYFDQGFTCAVDASAASATVGGGPVTFTPLLTGVQNPTCAWRLENVAGGEPIVGETQGAGEAGAFSVRFTEPGCYRVKLTVADGANVGTAELSDLIPVRQAGVFHVAKDGKSVPPYDTWENASTNLEAVVRFASNGSTVKVGAGTWRLENELNLPWSFLLQGAGMDVTFLRTGPDAKHRVLNLTSASTTVRDLTVTATVGTGFPESGAGVYVNGGLIENVRVTGCTAAVPCHGVAVSLRGGARMTHCIVNGNSGGDYGCVHVSGQSKADNCLFYENNARYGGNFYLESGGGTATNCTFATVHEADANSTWGIYNMKAAPDAVIRIVNSVVACGYTEFQNDKTPGLTVFENCATRTEILGTNNVVDALAFVDPANGDFHLPDDSKCHGRGLYADWMRKTTDLDGKRRAPGGVVDIGCYRVGRNGLMLLVR